MKQGEKCSDVGCMKSISNGKISSNTVPVSSNPKVCADGLFFMRVHFVFRLSFSFLHGDEQKQEHDILV